MLLESHPTKSCIADLPPTRLAEDPHRYPHEKETALHLNGDGTAVSITSFKKVVYKKLLKHPQFEIRSLTVINDNQHEQHLSSINEVLLNSELRIIGVTGTIPVGALTIGTPRKSNSHARIVA